MRTRTSVLFSDGRQSVAMLSDASLAIARAFWAGQFGRVPEQLFAERWLLQAHVGELADYGGVFALFREGSVAISVPEGCDSALRALLSEPKEITSPHRLANLLGDLAKVVIGPAYIGYAAEVTPPAQPVRELDPAADAYGPAIDELRAACPAEEWSHGGGAKEHPCSGAFVGGRLVSLASYEVWRGGIAHLSVITHPHFRNRGFGLSVVAHLAARALQEGLLPQYRTLEANRSSKRIAERLGFEQYATSVAARV